MEKTSYMLVIGDKGMENRFVAVRLCKDGGLGAMPPLENSIAKVSGEINAKSI